MNKKWFLSGEIVVAPRFIAFNYTRIQTQAYC
jgi:hypothetical protein